MENASPALDAIDASLSAMPEPSPVAATLAQNPPTVNNEPQQVRRGRGRPATPDAQLTPEQLKKRERDRARRAAQANQPAPPKPQLAGVAPQTPNLTVDPVAAKQAADRREVAFWAVSLVEQSGAMIDPEVSQMNPEEKAAIAGSFERYLASKNISDLPPGLALTCSLALYYGRFAQSVPARTKFQSFALWVSSKLKWRKKIAYVDNRPNSERENGSSQKAS